MSGAGFGSGTPRNEKTESDSAGAGNAPSVRQARPVESWMRVSGCSPGRRMVSQSGPPPPVGWVPPGSGVSVMAPGDLVEPGCFRTVEADIRSSDADQGRWSVVGADACDSVELGAEC